MRNRIDWRTIIGRINRGKFTPIVSDRAFFPGPNTLIERWADEIRYPFPVDRNVGIPHLAQFLSAHSRDELTVKESFLDFSKRYLLDTVRETAPAEQEGFLDTLEDELYDLTFSDVAQRLDFPRYEDEFENPLRIMAELPLPIYLTTSYYDFLEDALRAAGKEPRTEICYWSDTLYDIESIFNQEPDYQPSPEKPLVYHLNGLDRYPSSLVLSEDDYLDFLVKITQDTEGLPARVAQAMTDTSLLLLGYRLNDWNFKMLFRGLIKAKRASRRLFSLSIQIDPADNYSEIDIDPRDVQDYLDRYFDKANFDIYWGDPVSFMQELWDQWEK